MSSLRRRFGFEAGGFRCPSCGELLETKFWLNPQMLGLISAVLTAIGAFLVGFRGWLLLFITVIGSLVMLFLLPTILKFTPYRPKHKNAPGKATAVCD
jgi:hypothetical protein